MRDMVVLEFQLVATGHLSIILVDGNGKLVRTLHEDLGRTGKHRVSFNKGALDAGTYFVIINQDEKPLHREKIVVVD
jgi:hypothetical protein